jgi:hypothetical protein
MTDPITTRQFARVSGSPGEAPRLAGLLRVMWPFFLMTFAAGYLARSAWEYPYLDLKVIGGAFLFLAGGMAFSVSLGRVRLESFLKGARGEESVARALGFLPAAYRVYHGLSAGGGDYDHVVVGPTGVFLVETKSWNGRISVRDGVLLYNGEMPDRPPLEQVKSAAASLRRELRETVHKGLEVGAVLCFAQGYLPDGQAGASGVMICKPDTLLQILQEPIDHPLPVTVLDRIALYLDQRAGAMA